jgi:PAS domain S-box-containing protein
MMLPKDIRVQVADQVFRMLAPIVFGLAAVSLLITYFLGSGQSHRMIPSTIAMLLILPGWWLARRGRPLAGVNCLIACIAAAILSGMVVSGGIRAPIYIMTVACAALFTVLYGTRGGVIFAIIALSAGALFIYLESQGIVSTVQPPPLSLLLFLLGCYIFLSICFVSIPVRLMQRALQESQVQQQVMQEAVRQRQQTQEELKSILSKTPDIIYRLDRNGFVTYISDAVRKYGYTPSNVVGKPIQEFIHPDDQHLVREGLVARRTGKQGTKELEIRLMIGKTGINPTASGWLDYRWATFLVTSDGLYEGNEGSTKTYRGTQGMARDVSRTRQIEARVAQLASVVEQAAEDVLITDTKGRIQYVNPRFEAVTGYAREEVIGRTPRILNSGRHDRAFYAALWETISAGETWKGRIWNRTKQGREILQEVTITPIFDAGGQPSGYASVRRDVTRQAQVEQQLRQSQKMEAIGTLAGGIAHDFNNILAGIVGYTELALDEAQNNSILKNRLGRILEAGTRATDLVKQILSFSRSQKTDPKPVSPGVIAKEVLKLMRASLPSTIEIRQELDSKETVFADPTSVHQIVMNLCTNAGHAMRSTGGVLTVGIAEAALDATQVAGQEGMAPGKFLQLSVTDTGHGIPKDLQDKIFDPFFTTKGQGEGTGMGLAVVHGIVRDLGGMVTVRSESGIGSVFDVFLPILASPSRTEAFQETKLSSRGTERVLFVDDEAIQGELARDALGRLGYRVTVFADSVAAWMHLKEHYGAYDLLVTDMTMPKMTGDVLIKKVRLLRPEMPAILCTGFSEIMDEEKARAMNIDAFLLKPVAARDLARTIRHLLDNHRQGDDPGVVVRNKTAGSASGRQRV